MGWGKGDVFVVYDVLVKISRYEVVLRALCVDLYIEVRTINLEKSVFFQA